MIDNLLRYLKKKLQDLPTLLIINRQHEKNINVFRFFQNSLTKNGVSKNMN